MRRVAANAKSKKRPPKEFFNKAILRALYSELIW
jgi:hypothetical protein